MAKEALAVLGTLVAVVVVVTFLSGGNFSLGTFGGNPYFSLGYKGQRG
jgi:hypothetical protein